MEPTYTDHWHKTDDGSFSLWDPETQELHHNRAGAFTEAQHHYARPFVLTLAPAGGHLRWHDVCFGLGYNTWVLLVELLSVPMETPWRVEVFAYERDPNMALFWPQILKDPRFESLAPVLQALEHNKHYRTLQGVFDSPLEITWPCGHRLVLHLFWGDVRDHFQPVPAQAILHDAFSPRKVPELWTVDLFRQYHQSVATTAGILLTYSTAPAVLGGLQQAGFSVYRTPALGAKRGGTLACAQPLELLLHPIQLLSDEEAKLIQGARGLPYQAVGTRQEIIDARTLKMTHFRNNETC
jgi:hypothetical protein